MATTPARMQQRRRTQTQYASENPTLAAGELAAAIPASQERAVLKIGDGTTAWNSLAWLDGRTGISISSPMMDAGSLSRIRTFRTPRIVMPATGTSSILIGPFGFPTFWFERGIIMGYDVVNDSSATGNIRWRFTLQGNNIGSLISGASAVFTETVTKTAPAGDTAITTQLVNNGNPVSVTPGGFGTLYVMEIERLGDDAADTLAGPVGFCEFVYLAAK